MSETPEYYSEAFDFIVNYYNGHLPTKFSKDEQYELIKLAQHGDYAAQNKLVESYIKFIIKIACSNHRPGSDLDELFQEGVVGCIKAIRTFNLETGYSFSTYAGIVIGNEMKMFLRSLKLKTQLVSLNEPINIGDDGEELYLIDILEDDNINNSPAEYVEAVIMKELIMSEIDKLPKRDREILEYRFGLNERPKLTQTRIGKLFGCSQTSISKKVKAILFSIRENIEFTLN